MYSRRVSDRDNAGETAVPSPPRGKLSGGDEIILWNTGRVVALFETMLNQTSHIRN
ncbi:hypothetical protein WN55_09301 [Dufourea novaeangliae]|uniref:Uncharacterized protein n=1 Tax=Dufourea novaeangliae TaxID=178035 RepID=A0A154P991_DUFNO|nr:hypothetical protein WN55_09301 [Dufourea novaeangliae]